MTFTIERMKDGGFVVSNEGKHPEYGFKQGGLIFACTDLGEAVAYIRQKYSEPQEPRT